ncbi:DUF2726 domain-containing protein [Vibrio sp. 378]|uniref:DUF2726 domain-containing protein n=1 Tax=Vibrio TaxID=662 RepID=UPI00211A1621|nr:MULTISPECIES: DUF2726 domain-containing protein [Vibrio]MCQ9062463.1 DUF2726 domain-containing protein [Vibrio alginolyticus]MDW2149588.1 DUF2726 domain-containing protein [Vibrio sp. 378]
MEKFYTLLASQSWSEILELVKTEQVSLKNNGVEWARISGLLENEFIKYARNEKNVLVSKLCSEYLKLQVSDYIKVSNEGLNQIESIGFEASLALSDSDAKIFSQLCANNEAAMSYKIASAKPKSATTNETSPRRTRFARTDWLVPLFKSEQERLFNQALKEVFPNFFIYPNVAVSNLFDFSEIKVHLTSDERDYFFKAIVDFVIYDPVDYTPKYFFEVDSVYHDTAEATIRDNKKNTFFEVAGLNLYRVRLQSDSLTQKHEFIREIRALTAQGI